MTIIAHRGYLKWTPEEDEVLISAWRDALGVSGQARRGFYEDAHKIFPHRTFWSVKNRVNDIIVKNGLPRQYQRSKYSKLDLTEPEKAWLAGILDGEGSIRKINGITRKGLSNGFVVQVITVYNTDMSIIDYARKLVPHSKIGVSPAGRPHPKGVIGTKPMYRLLLSGFIPVLDYLESILPYIVHTEKRIRAIGVIEFINNRPGFSRPW